MRRANGGNERGLGAFAGGEPIFDSWTEMKNKSVRREVEEQAALITSYSSINSRYMGEIH
jgi:hypothetical protein